MIEPGYYWARPVHIWTEKLHRLKQGYVYRPVQVRRAHHLGLRVYSFGYSGGDCLGNWEFGPRIKPFGGEGAKHASSEDHPHA